MVRKIIVFRAQNRLHFEKVFAYDEKKKTFLENIVYDFATINDKKRLHKLPANAENEQ